MRGISRPKELDISVLEGTEIDWDTGSQIDPRAFYWRPSAYDGPRVEGPFPTELAARLDASWALSPECFR